MTFTQILVVVFPVFALIGLGFAMTRFGLLRDTVGDGLGEFVYLIAIPVLIFKTVAGAHFPDLSPWPLWGAYFGGAIVAWAAASLAARHLFGRPRAEAVIAGVSGSYANLVMIGLPLTLSAFGEAGAVPLLMIISVHLPIMMVAGTLMTERAVRLDGGGGDDAAPAAARLARRLLHNLVLSPLVIALAAGAAFRVSGLALSGAVLTTVEMIAQAAVPCSLISLGMGLKRYGLIGDWRAATVIGIVKLVLMPAVVYGLGHYVFGLVPLWTAVATIGGALASGINAYLFAVRFQVGQAMASNAIALTTVASVVTVVFWFNVVGGGLAGP
jgi:hypothetical protein